MGDEIRVTVIAAGFDRYEDPRGAKTVRTSRSPLPSGGFDDRPIADPFAEADDFNDGDDDFDVPSFLK